MSKWHHYTSLYEAEAAALKINLHMGVPIAMPEEVEKHGVKIYTASDGWAIAQTPMSVKLLGESKLQEVEIPVNPPQVVEVKKDYKKLIIGISLGLISLIYLIIRGLK